MYERAMDLLVDVGIKPSYQRLLILDYLLKHDTHPTAETIFLELKNESPTISKATVYNTLHLFTECGLLSSMSPDHSEIHYDLDVSEHAHFVCLSCGKIQNFPYELKSLDDSLVGFSIEQEEIVVSGLCNQCKHHKEKK
ncbi:Fur family transcriptional regulator [Guggenheimella bovis]